MKLFTPAAKSSRGFSLVEIGLSLLLLVSVTGFIAVQTGEYFRSLKERNNSEHFAEVVAATRDYFKKKYSFCPTSASPAPADCFNDGEARIIMLGTSSSSNGDGTLIGEGALRRNFRDTNGYRQSYRVLAYQEPRSNPVDPPRPLRVMVMTEGGNDIPYVSLYTMARQIGSAGGFMSDRAPYVTSQIYGAENGWTSPVSYWSSRFPSVNFSSGHLFADLSVGTSNVLTDYLYRNEVPGYPEANEMNTNIGMNNNDIVNLGPEQSDGSGFRASEGVYEVSIRAPGQTIAKPVCYNAATGPSEVDPKQPVQTARIYVSAVALAESNGSPISGFRAYATDVGASWTIGLMVRRFPLPGDPVPAGFPAGTGWVDVNYGYLLVMTKCES